MKKTKYFWRISVLLLLLLSVALPAYAAVYTYDDLGRLTTVTYDNGQKLTYNFDSGGNLLSVISPDTTAPTVSSNDPANNATNVAVNKTVTVTFNEPIVEGTNFSSITLQAGTTTITTTKTVSGNTLTIAPTTNFDYSTTYTVTIPSGAIKDLAGNALATTNSFNFTTQATQDTIAPTVSSTNPSSGGLNIPINNPITATFSENVLAALNFSNITLQANNTIVGSTSSISGEVLTINPTQTLSYNTTYTVTIPSGAVKDGAGNALVAAYTFSFTTLATADATTPVVSITSPANSNTVSGKVYLTASATDNVGVTKVEFYIDGELVGTSLGLPYQYGWQTTTGTHVLLAKAYDAVGNVGESSPVSVTANAIAPLSITSPAEGSIVGGVINTFNLTFSQPFAGSINLYIGGMSRFQTMIGPSPVTSASISYSWDTNEYADGTSTIIEIRSNNMLTGILASAQNTVTIDNIVDITAPEVMITSPTNGSTVNNLVEITATATDKVGVTKVEFYVDGILKGECTSAPYVYAWTSTVGNHTLIAKAFDAAGNVGTSTIAVTVPAIVTITNPADVSQVTGIITSFNATFSAPISGSAYLNIDGYRKANKYLSSGATSISIPYSWDTNLCTNGTSHIIEIVGYTQVGSIKSSGISVVNVYNAVKITSPANGSTVGVSGDIIPITAEVADNIVPNKVEFYVDGVLKGESTTSPFAYNWQSTGGIHSLVAKAYDGTGNVWTSSTTSVNIPAIVTVTTPADGSTVSGTISSFTATFSEPINSQGYLFIDGYTTAIWMATPGATSVTFPYTWNTTGYLNGTSHVIEVWGYTQSGYVKSIGTSTVIVNN